GLSKNGTGTLTLTGSNSAVAGNLVFNAGKVTINPGVSGTFTSSGRFQILPGSSVTTTVEVLSGSNSFSTAAGIGGLADNAATGTALWNLSGGTTTLGLVTNRFLIGNKGAGTVTVSNDAVFTITGTPDLVIGGDQQYALSNATGVVTVSGGTLSITGAGNLILGRNVSGTTTGANGTVNLDGGVFGTVRPFTMASGSGAGTGTVNFNGGTLRALGSSSDFIAVTAANVKNGGAVIDTNSYNVTIAQSLLNGGAGGLTKQGGGVLTLSASNSYIGTTVVSGGTLKAANVNAFGSAAITLSSGATLDLNSFAVANSITNNGGTLSNATSYAGTQSLAGAATFGAVAGTLSVVNGGAATLGGAVTGTVSIAGGGGATLAAGGSLAQSGLANNGTFTVNRNDNLSLATVISGSGGLVKLGSGTLTITSSNTFTGNTTVSAGKLAVNGVLGSGSLSVAAAAWLAGNGTIGGPVSVQGTLSPGNSPGLLTMQSLDLLASSTTAMEIGGTGRGTGYDAIDITSLSGLSFGGLLELNFTSTFPDNTTFDLFGFSGSPAGTFSSVTAAGSYGSLTFVKQAGVWTAQSGTQTISFTESTGNVIVVPEPATAALGGSAAVGLALWARRKRLWANR
ncbi:MAG: beta strand repeat-containing protein, partial [Pirellulales bacterium]